MTVKISLDTNALASIIENDPEFLIQVQGAVIANIAQRYVKGVDTEIQAAVQAAANVEKVNLWKKYGSLSGGWNSKFTLNNAISDEIKREVQDLISREFSQLVRKAATEAVELQKQYIEGQIKREVSTYSNQAISKHVQEKVSSALSQIKF